MKRSLIARNKLYYRLFIILDVCRTLFSINLLNILQTGLGVLLTTLQIGVRRTNRSSNSVEGKALRLSRELRHVSICQQGGEANGY
jgi:hypothetical protein